MTGEMAWINQDGKDSDGNTWYAHATVAKAVGGRLEPFDHYQGPYIVIGRDLRAGQAPYSVPVQHLGIVRLWLTSTEDGMWQVYREDRDTYSELIFPDDEANLVEAALALVYPNPEASKYA